MRKVWQQSGRWSLLGALLRERAVGFWLLGFAVIYLSLSLFEVSVWRCAWKLVTGLRCPGCGLTTGCKAFLRGDFVESFTRNWFAPLVVIGLFLFAIVIALPKTIRMRVIERLERLEGRFRVVLLFFVIMVVQTIARSQGWA